MVDTVDELIGGSVGVVRLKALGECALETEHGRIGPDSPYAFALGLYLVLEGGKRTPRQALIDMLWPDVKDERHARHRFRQTLLRLRQLGVPIESDNSHLEIRREHISMDFDMLLNANGNAEEVVQGRESFQFLRGYQPRVSEEYARWLDIHRSQIELGIQRLFVSAMRSARARGDWPTLERLALDCLRLDQLNEEATMARAEATAMRGSKTQALRILDNYMDAIGDTKLQIGLPAKLLRTRIAERISQPKYATLSEAHFVGREEEVALLSRMLDDAKDGRGGAVLFVGPVGMGKTRLVTEISRIAVMNGTPHVVVTCQPANVDRPLALLVELVAALRSLPGSIGASVESLSLLHRLTEYARPESARAGADTPQAGGAIRHAVSDLFDAVADEGPILVIVEDTHWADTFSWGTLETLAETSSRRSALVVATARLETRGHMGEGHYLGEADTFQIRTLPPLRHDASTELAQQLLESQGASAPPATLHWCVTVSEGNPYYLRELLTHWLETREPYGVPRSLMQLIDRRLDALGSDATRVFHACVALGTLSTAARLEKLQIMEPSRLLAALEELAMGGLITAEGAAIVPKHDLLAQASSNRLAAAVRAVIHRRIASVLEAETKAELIPSALWDCAHHWELAGEPGRALEFLRYCGEHLLSIGLPDEAARLYRRTLGMDPSTPQQRLELHHGLITALRQSGFLSQVQAEIRALRESALLMGQVLPVHSDLEHLEVEAGWRSHSHDGHIAEQLKNCLVATDASVAHRLHAGFWLLAIAHSLGDRALALEAWQRAEPLMLNANSPVAQYQLGMVFHTDYGDLDKAVEYSRMLVEASRRTGDAVGLHRALRNSALALRRAGNVEEARSRLYEALDLATTHHATLHKVEAAHSLAGIALEEGDIASANAWIGRCDEWLAGWESPLQEADLTIVRARIKLATGDLRGARESARQLPNWQGLRSRRLAQTIASVYLMIGVRSDDPEEIGALVPPLSKFYEAMADLGHQDFAIEALVRATTHLQQQEHARSTLQDYITVKRRDRGMLPPSLLDLADELAISTNRD